MATSVITKSLASDVAALSSEVEDFIMTYRCEKTSANSITLTTTGACAVYLFISGSSGGQYGVIHINCTSSGTIATHEALLSDSLTVTTGSYSVTLSYNSSQSWLIGVMQIRGLTNKFVAS